MKPSDNEIETLAAGFAIQHKNGLIRFAHALLDKYAPQASAEGVRNAALEEAAHLMEQTGKRIAASDIRALKTQADKDGGQQLDGDVDERAAFEAWAYRAGMGPKFRESMFAAWEARAALSAPQAEQGERDA